MSDINEENKTTEASKSKKGKKQAPFRINNVSLIIENDKNEKFYYDKDKDAFVYFTSKDKPAVCALQAIDFLTASYQSRQLFVEHYGIPGNVTKLYVSYQSKGEKRLKAVFNNETWQNIALLSHDRELKFDRDTEIRAFYRAYYLLINPNSNYRNYLQDPNCPITFSKKATNAISAVLSHEDAIKEKQKNEYNGSIHTYDAAGVYLEDQKLLRKDLMNAMKRYKDFRSFYLSACNYAKWLVSLKTPPNSEQLKKKKVLYPGVQMKLINRGNNEWQIGTDDIT